MILNLADAANDEHNVGTKARTLAQLTAAGFAVPGGMVIPGETLDRVIHANGQAETVASTLRNLSNDNVLQTAQALATAMVNLQYPDDVLRGIRDEVRPDGLYAVRSSGTQEDLEGLSFAGQYHTVLDVVSADVPSAVLECYRSLFGPTVLNYMLDNGITPTTTGMSVIVQHMVHAELSGIAFTVNPLTGADTEVVIEVAEGRGDALVSGQVAPERHIWDWYKDGDVKAKDIPPGRTLLTERQRAEIVATVVRIQEHFGHPCDIEFAIADGQLIILQSRPITRIGYSGIPDQWTTADFKDGGVSATVCTPFMWSLYEYVWEIELRRFFLEAKILKKRDFRPLGHMFYGRPYWNLSVVKHAMSRVPGYRERQFDNELGVRPSYEGDGVVTKVNPRSLWRVARIAVAMNRFTAERRRTNAARQAELLARYNEILSHLAEPMTAEEFASAWRHLVTVDYLDSEGWYFWQIFINTIHQSIARDSIVKVSGDEGYLALMGGLEAVSHLRPFYDIWDITRRIRAEPADMAFWTDTDIDHIEARLESGDASHHLDELRVFLGTYGYHSDKELDVTHPDYAEDPQAVIAMFRDTVQLDDRFGPAEDRARVTASYQAQLARIQQEVSPRRFRRVQTRVDRIRRMLWWREEFRDVSTHYYHLIRLYTLELARQLCESGVIDQEADIWFATMRNLCDHLDGVIDAGTLRGIIDRNRTYYGSFRHFPNENEIGASFGSKADDARSHRGGDAGTLVGVGGSSGTVTGVARVIGGLDEIGLLQPGDILVTRFTDTGWTSKFAILSGIVTEYGGILCHAAIVSREYDIPCVVCVENATTAIPDGATIRVNGTTGKVTLLTEGTP
jgi:pyruvate,water dikinase